MIDFHQVIVFKHLMHCTLLKRPNTKKILQATRTCEMGWLNQSHPIHTRSPTT